MILDKQHTSTAMPVDSENMKGFEVDGSIPDRYQGSAGEQMELAQKTQRHVC